MLKNERMSVSDTVQLNEKVNMYNKKVNTHSKTRKELDKNDFLQLLVKQMSYQDPSNPMSNEQMISQFTQLASVEQNIMMADKLNTLTEEFEKLKLMNLLGKEVSFQKNNQVSIGKINEIKWNDSSQVKIGNEFIDASRIHSIIEGVN